MYVIAPLLMRIAFPVVCCSKEDKEFVQQSTEAEMVQLFRLYDELCEQRQELENKLDEAEDVQLP